MSARRIPTYDDIPDAIKKAFGAPWSPVIEEEVLEREVAARAVLDALGHTGEPDSDDHRKAVLDAREWFRAGESVYGVFENAGLEIENLRVVMMTAIEAKRGYLEPVIELKRKGKK